MKFFPEKLTIEWISSCYQSGELNPLELVEEIIQRSQKYTEKNIWIVPPQMELIKPYIEKLGKTSTQKPLWGIPFAIKDNIDLENVPTTAACPDYAYTPKSSASVVQRLIDAGAIPVGKTNLDQFATGLVGTRSPYGECHNAYQDQMISGGSSSGSAVAVALGLCAFSLGTDTAGSGRVPAMLNSLVGYKPSCGAWSTKGLVPACRSLDCITVFANDIQDASLVDSYARGFDQDCDWSKKIEKKGPVLPKKIYLPKSEPEFFGDWKETYKSKWNNCLKRIKKLSQENNILIEEIDYSIFQKVALILYEGAYVAERWEDLKDFIQSHPGKIFPVTETILRSGQKEENTAAKLFSNLHEIQKYRHISQELLDDSVMIMPTAGGSFTREQVRKDPIATNSKMGLYTNHCNLLDLAAIALPEDSRDRDFPFGITVFSLSDSENLLWAFGKTFLQSESLKLCVCGLHKKGCEFESQIIELGGTFLEHTETAPLYQLYQLNTVPVKPGMLKLSDTKQGKAIPVDLYEIPKSSFGYFMDRVLPPHTIGSVTLKSGQVVKGFLCESYAAN
ncbi:MAG: allophanate hydrolase [Treponema sp.]|nr:allophanate hydrolase [Treponema sp.]